MKARFSCVYEAKCADLKSKILLCSDGEHLTNLEFVESAESVESQDSHAKNLRDLKIDSSVESSGDLCVESGIELGDLPIFAESKKWLDLYFSGAIPRFAPKIALPKNASAFALRVWEILRMIPHGKTTTYGAIARQIAREFGITKMSAQAVGGAVGRNPIAIIIPCHRVVGTNGNLTGYAGGIANKIALLQIEGIATNRLKMPKI